MNFSIVSLLFFTLLAAPLTKCHSDYNKVVVKLTGSNFNELVLKNDRPVLVKFFAPYCGHCRKMMPTYDKLAENLRDLVDIAAIDCTDTFNAPMCSKYRVDGYPTLKLFVIQEVDGKKKKVVLDYHGDRSLGDMTSFIKKHMHKFIFKVSKIVPKALNKWNVNFETFFSKGGNMPKLMLFRSNTNENPTMLFRALSIRYHYKIVVGEVSTQTDPEIPSKFNLPKGKVGLVYFTDGTEDGKTVLYEGKVSREDIFTFLDKQLSMRVEEKSEL